MLVAIALVIDEAHDQVLLALRPEHKSQGGLWELPGGKVEAQETLWQALVRELQEELGMTPLSGELISELSYDYPEYSVHLKTFAVYRWSGTIYGREGQAYRWVHKKQLINYPMPSGTQQVLRDIQWL